MRRRSCGTLAWLLVLALAGAARADPAEPPPEAPDGEDYTAEPADSIDAGTVEMELGASGRPGERPRQRRRVRVRDGDFSAEAREGTGDPLAGGSLETRAGGGGLAVGRLAPRWGRGLVLGAPVEPWRGRGVGEREPFRGRPGDGVRWRSREGTFEMLAGRFGKRDVAGLRATAGAFGTGVLAGADGGFQSSLGIAHEDLGAEAALDRSGRWRSEARIERPLAGWRAIAQARAGHIGFQSLAEPRRAGPAQALLVAGERRLRGARVSALAGAWRFAPGVTGARAALELRARLTGRDAFSAGLEEQHGARRADVARVSGMRQGAWAEWRSAPAGPLTLSLRDEVWGARAWARAAVRRASGMRIDVRGPKGSVVRLTHSAWRTRSGESLYLPEAESDRVVLRALSGAGERTRLECELPVAGGIAGATLAMSATAAAPPRAQWTVHWTRRTRTRTSNR